MLHTILGTFTTLDCTREKKLTRYWTPDKEAAQCPETIDWDFFGWKKNRMVNSVLVVAHVWLKCSILDWLHTVLFVRGAKRPDGFCTHDRTVQHAWTSKRHTEHHTGCSVSLTALSMLNIHVNLFALWNTFLFGRFFFRWARFVAEKNPSLGRVLAKALKAYRNQDW